MASWCDGGDAEWEGIVQAKNDLLSVKDDALTELQKDLDRQRALIARMNKSSYGGQGTTSTASLGSEIPAGGGRITSVDAGDWRHDATYGATHDRLGSTAAERATSSAIGRESTLLKDVEDKNRRIASLEIEMMDMRDEVQRLEDVSVQNQHLAATAVDAAEQRALHTQLSAHEDLSRLQARLDEREQRLLELERLQHAGRSTEQELHRKLVALEDYLAELPTNDQWTDRGDELARHQRRADLLEIQLEEAENEVQLLSDSMADRDREISSAHEEVAKFSDLLSDSEAARAAEVQMVEESRQQLAIEMQKIAAQLATTQAELSETHTGRLALKQQVGDMRALFAEEENRGRRADATLAGLRGDVKQLQQRERHQQTTINALEDIKFGSERKVAAQSSTIRDLRQALNSLQAANKELLSGHVVTRTVSIPEQYNGEDGGGIPTSRSSARSAEVHDALADCLHELQGLVHTVEAKSRGEEPPIGEMLGLDRPPELGAHFVRTNDPDEQLHTVTEMRRTVSRLRQQVCNKYAGDLGPEACAMQ